MQRWVAREGELHEAVAAEVRATGRAIALRAANPAARATARLAAEPLTRGLTVRPAAAALLAALAGEAGVRADRPDADTRVAGTAAAADAAGDRAQRDAGPRQEEARPERPRSEPLEELTPRGAFRQ